MALLGGAGPAVIAGLCAFAALGYAIYQVSGSHGSRVLFPMTRTNLSVLSADATTLLCRSSVTYDTTMAPYTRYICNACHQAPFKITVYRDLLTLWSAEIHCQNYLPCTSVLCRIMAFSAHEREICLF